MPPSFHDHFSRQAASYSEYRPLYPKSLFAYLSSISPDRTLAWDCATGSGQAAVGLADHFHTVIASDASHNQISQARTHSRIFYFVASAERSGIRSHSLDLVTVAQALHWFDLEGFFTEVGRVLRPGGVFCAWSYNLLRVSTEIDAVINTLYEEVLGSYWPPERRLVEIGYRDIELPFFELKPPILEMSASWNLRQLMGYLESWSAAERYRQATREDPLTEVAPALHRLWGHAENQNLIRWPLTLRVGRKGKGSGYGLG